MATHFTYENPDKDLLCQGDVLKRTPRLQSVLAECHSYYADHRSYRHFLVLTQSCDLYRREDSPPAARYITLAAVRPVKDAILQAARSHQVWWQEPEKVLGSRAFDQMTLFLESLFNNNVPNYFYVHEDISLGISDPHCAFLALSIPLKIEHYDLCLEAKIAQIKEPFQAKLGWLLGNMYNRVGTEEWNEHYGANNAQKQAARLLKDTFAHYSDEQIATATKALRSQKELKGYSPDEIHEAVSKNRLVPRSRRFAERVESILSDFSLVGEVRDRALTAMIHDEELSTQLQSLLLEQGVAEPEVVGEEVKRLLLERLCAVISDESLPGREKLVRKLAAAIREDTQIKSLFT